MVLLVHFFNDIFYNVILLLFYDLLGKQLTDEFWFLPGLDDELPDGDGGDPELLGHILYHFEINQNCMNDVQFLLWRQYGPATTSLSQRCRNTSIGILIFNLF